MEPQPYPRHIDMGVLGILSLRFRLTVWWAKKGWASQSDGLHSLVHLGWNPDLRAYFAV